MVATKHWKETPSRTFENCVWWLKDNQRKFRDDLRPSTLLERLQERNAWLDRENPRWREELKEQQLRDLEAMQENARRFYEEHPDELEKRRKAAEEAARRIELWHERFRDDPKGALAELIDELKKPDYDA